VELCVYLHLPISERVIVCIKCPVFIVVAMMTLLTANNYKINVLVLSTINLASLVR